jgi:hypothetical protein
MSKPYIHAESSVRKFGGKTDDYIEIHNLMDSSKAAICDNRHRALTHNSWFIGTILEKIFGVTITNSDGDKVSVRDVGEQHVSEDLKGKYIPTAQDYLQEMDMQDWMMNGKNGHPASVRRLVPPQKFEPKQSAAIPADFLPPQSYDGSNKVAPPSWYE